MSLIEYEKTKWLSKDGDGNIPANAPAINAENLNHIEDGIGKCVDGINDLNVSQEKLKANIPNLFKGDLLWVNEDIDKEMDDQTITMDLSEYVRFVVLCKEATNKDWYNEHYISCKDRNVRITVNITSDYVYTRLIKFSDNTITISDVYRGSYINSVSNKYGIVVEIYGYKN